MHHSKITATDAINGEMYAAIVEAIKFIESLPILADETRRQEEQDRITHKLYDAISLAYAISEEKSGGVLCETNS